MDNYNYFSQQFEEIQSASIFGSPDNTTDLKELIYEMLDTIKFLEENMSIESQRKKVKLEAYE